MRNLKTSLQQNFIIFAKSPAAIITIVLPLFLLFTIGTITPVAWILPQIITLSIISISFLSIGVQYNEYRKTNFFKTNKTTQVKNSVIILGTFIVTFVISTAVIFSLFVLTWFFTQAVPILSQTVDNVRIPGLESIQAILKNQAIFSTFSFENIKWIEFIYSVLISIIMTSLLAILIGNLIPSFKVYTLFSIFYITIFILLSGLIIPQQSINNVEAVRIISEIIPNINTSNMIETSMGTNISSQIGPYTIYLDGLSQFMKNVIENPDSISYQDLQKLIAGGIDPFDLSFLINAYPMLATFIIDAVTIVNNLFGTSYNPDSATLFFVIIIVEKNSYSADSFIKYVQDLVNFIDKINLEFHSIVNIPNAFGVNLYGLKTNLIPILIMIISIPTFIKVVNI